LTYQDQSNAYVAFKAQSALGTQATGSGATVLRNNGGQGGRLTMEAIESGEVRSDMMSTRGRHGSQKTNGAYSSEISLGGFDAIMEAVMRGTFGAADLAITQSAMTSVTTGANTIVAAAGSWITQGLRVGDVIRGTGLSDAANNSKNLRITGLTASTITVAETLVVNAVADTSFTITRTGRPLISAASPVKRFFTIEEYEADLDSSEVFTDCVWGSLHFSMQPNGIFMIEPSWVGTGQFQTVTGASAPFFTTPTTPTGTPLAALEATVRYGSTDLLDLTAFDMTIDITPSSPDVVAARYSPAVFTGSMAVSMNLTTLRPDLLDVANYLNETQLSLHVLLVEPESEPKDFISIYVPNFTLGSVDKSALAKAGGGRTQTLAVPAALVGKDERGGAYDATMVKVQVSNAS
jgi:hypothetical protein